MTILHGDCREQLATIDAGTVDACVTDPPYELGFMGKRWDQSGVACDPAVWAEVLRVLKPGGFLLCFGGTRTYHRLTCAVEDAGFDIRDSIAAWLYSSGFPKGKGQLKPAWEPIVVARKPAPAPVLQIDACRVGMIVETWPVSRGPNTGGSMSGGVMARRDTGEAPAGRWPANTTFCHHPDCADPGPCAEGCWVAELDRQSGMRVSGGGNKANRRPTGLTQVPPTKNTGQVWERDEGGASRFFPTFRYQAKAPTRERPKVDGVSHPTVKPLALIRWLIRLVTPPGGLVLDPFLGSGTTAEACELEGFDWVGCERDPTYLLLIEQRLNRAMQPPLALDLPA